MKLVEADGKKICIKAGIAVPAGVFVAYGDSAVDLSGVTFPCYVKSQVLQGRRGTRGWIRRCVDVDECHRVMAALRVILKDVPCAGFILEPETVHDTEWLVSVGIDRESGRAVVSYSAQGGMEVSTASQTLVDTSADVASIDVPSNVKDVLVKLVDAFFAHDALSLEINPLAVRADGSCIALDAKVELDDAAAFRHPEWKDFFALPETGRHLSVSEEAYAKRQEQAGHRGTLGRYVELDGDIALVLSGGGASLVAMDALRVAGGKPANYVEMSGNPDPEAVREGAKIVLSKPGIRTIWIAGSFANFTDIQATVNAVLAAVAELRLHVPIVIRRDGPNIEVARNDAMTWAAAHGCSVRFDRADTDLDMSARAVVAASRATIS